MGLLDGLIGGVVGAGLTKAIGSFVESHGGVQGIVKQFEEKGLGATVQSWVGTGANLPIDSAQIQSVLGSDTLKNLAEKFGIPSDQIAAKLAEFLPETIDKLTPNGQIPAVQSTAA